MVKLARFVRLKGTGLLVASFVVLAIFVGKRTYNLASAPTKEKDCDFIYPDQPSDTKIELSYHPLDQAKFDVVQTGGTINDASCLNKTVVHAVAAVQNEEDVREALKFARENDLNVTPAGIHHSMGGQSFSRGGLVLDMRRYNQVEVDEANKTMTVQSGATWKEVQEVLDPMGLAVKAMQSINLFTVGGSLSVNAHGIAHDPGQIAPTVRSMRIMLSSGEVRMASPTRNTELFHAVIGGYGLAGVILDAEFDIVANEVYEWRTDYINYQDFGRYYNEKIKGNDEIALTYGRLSVAPNSYLTETVVHRYVKINFASEPIPLAPPNRVWLKRLIFNFSKTGSFGRWIRWAAEKNIRTGEHSCISRNQIMSGTADEICLASRNQKMNESMEFLANKQKDTDILQEYFIPQENTSQFIDGLRETVLKNDVNLLNVTIRVVTKDEISALPYAKDDRIAFVLYFNQRLNEFESKKMEQAIVEFTDLAIKNGGTYYLPYQLHYSEDQLRAAYPEIDDFFALKRKYDPSGLLSNAFYEKYGRLRKSSKER